MVNDTGDAASLAKLPLGGSFFVGASLFFVGCGACRTGMGTRSGVYGGLFGPALFVRRGVGASFMWEWGDVVWRGDRSLRGFARFPFSTGTYFGR